MEAADLFQDGIMWRRLLLVSLLVPVARSTQAQELQQPDLFDLDLQALMQVQIYSASKNLAAVDDAPAVVSVITDSEIKRRGLKTVKEVLDRVPGFLTMPDESTYLISNRGFTQNPNSNYLILLDGQALNNQRWEGAEEYFLFPSLAQVKRIEIIRGPGSTLWGSDAAMGIINIISYDASDRLGSEHDDFVETGIDYESNAERSIVHLLWAHRFDLESDWINTIQYSRSRAEWFPVYQPGNTGVVLTDYSADAYLYYDPSYEWLSKWQWRDLKISGRLFHFEHYETFGTADDISAFPHVRTGSEKDTHNWFVRADYNPRLSNEWFLESHLFTAAYRLNRGVYYLEHLPEHVYADDEMIYDEWGGEMLLIKRSTDLVWKLGGQSVARDFRDQRREDYNQIVSDADQPTLSGIEHSNSIFVEADYKNIEDFIFTAGVRYDKNDFRLADSTVYPRFAIICKPEGRLSFKYSYNRGYVRPTVERVDGTPERPLISRNRALIGPENPQTAISNDFQFNYHNESVRASATFYAYKVIDYIARLGYEPGTSYQGYLVRYQNQNLGELNGRGVELEMHYVHSERLQYYLNYAYADAKFSELDLSVAGGATTFNIVTDMNYANPDRSTTGVPKRLWNIGADWHVSDNIMLNIHHRGWDKNNGKVSREPRFEHFGPVRLWDVNVTWRAAFGNNSELSFYVKNIGNSKVKFPQAPHGGYIEEGFREIGLAMQYDWRL